jgi:low affinity Fe/Cu permease
MSNIFARFSHTISHLSGRPATFVIAVLLVLAWAVSGPFFGFSETWQLVINTATTIVTFLMVFVLQNTQERDGEAVQAKLDDLIYAVRGADNHFVQAERLSDEELHNLRERLLARCKLADSEIELRSSRKRHSPDPDKQPA